MAHRIVSDQDFLAIALDLFRTYGFDGVSLKQLADATSLEKASMYYRYPGGKDEIAMAVAQGVGNWFEENVFEVLKSEAPIQERTATVVRNIQTLYGDGKKSCVVDVLSLPGGPDTLRAALRTAVERWIEAFQELARESGMPLTLARERAEEAVLRIEGALVLSRVLEDTAVFERTMRVIPGLLTEQ
ncbi:TetR/AcrR family transcriptional regulator [Silvibacterium acidisoli]|uniref:TetR/AcrR family transcriptional regulator n=1 Tax=Acidobacteriaceae bacterium ZG23-2 TaxID=2883246 RepID=UPI00406C88B0